MCEFFVAADPILYESRTRTVRIRGVSTSIRMENFIWDTLARLAAACALIAFLLHTQRNKINAMFIKKNKTEPQISEAATPPAINP